MAEKAAKLLEQARQSTANWTRGELDELYIGFGFQIRHGSKHDVVKHPQFPHLRATLPRHGSLAKGYISFAVRLIDKLQELVEDLEGGDSDEH